MAAPANELAITVFASSQAKTVKAKAKLTSNIPLEISNDPDLLRDIEILPKHYNFEIPKTIWRIRQLNAKCVGLQLPEGLLIFALPISDIIEKHTDANTIVFGDVTYGACCVDDLGARALRVDLLVHYGHSCLIPVDRTANLKFLYVFVDIKIDIQHLIDTIKTNIESSIRLALVSTIQFVPTIQTAAAALKEVGYTCVTPQIKPLSPGEVLGCTSPQVEGIADAIIYVGDGRFHLESAMIANPTLAAYCYDPYTKRFTLEEYDHSRMRSQRTAALQAAKTGNTYGVILGTLGRQGSVKVLEQLTKRIEEAGKECFTVLLSEIFPDKLDMFPQVDVWVQVACPRLSIDWGAAFKKPLLTPYELNILLSKPTAPQLDKRYPMDFYAKESLGPWTPNHVPSDKTPIFASKGCVDCKCDKSQCDKLKGHNTNV